MKSTVAITKQPHPEWIAAGPIRGWKTTGVIWAASAAAISAPAEVFHISSFHPISHRLGCHEHFHH